MWNASWFISQNTLLCLVSLFINANDLYRTNKDAIKLECTISNAVHFVYEITHWIKSCLKIRKNNYIFLSNNNKIVFSRCFHSFITNAIINSFQAYFVLKR